MKKNNNLHKAKSAKNDEFYTRIEDVEKEMKHYKDHFKGKSVYLNCDADWSNFFIFFKAKFTEYGLKKVVATHFISDGVSIKREITQATGDNGNVLPEDIIETPLRGNGDFRSDESVELLKDCDIVVTNPPFSLFREFVDSMMTSGKKFIIVGRADAIIYKNVTKYVMANLMWLGINNLKSFKLPCGGEQKFGNITWHTNIEHAKRFNTIFLTEKYCPSRYIKYDNHTAINIDKVVNIPEDYSEVMGVPISYLTKHNPSQFTIVGIRKGSDGKDLRYTDANGKVKEPYTRLLIKRKQQ